MVRVLWLLVSVTSAVAGFVVAYTIDKSFGWPSILAAIGVWVTASFILQRQAVNPKLQQAMPDITVHSIVFLPAHLS
jgi:hypothetical protein